jgi:hypothetical protein
VQYLDNKGRVLVTVDEPTLEANNDQDNMLRQILEGIYGVDSPYAKASTYPRFRFPMDGMEAGFYALDVNLTYLQIVRLREALDLFNRATFASMKSDLFSADIAYVVIDKISGSTAGLTYAGTGVVELDRRDLFGNRYILASVIAHEGSHVLQGAMPANAGCDTNVRREIGDQTIPDGFYNWDATTLLQAIKDSKIGAYHVSLWMLYKLGVPNTSWIVDAIHTGKVGDESVVSCQK